MYFELTNIQTWIQWSSALFFAVIGQIIITIITIKKYLFIYLFVSQHWNQTMIGHYLLHNKLSLLQIQRRFTAIFYSENSRWLSSASSHFVTLDRIFEWQNCAFLEWVVSVFSAINNWNSAFLTQILLFSQLLSKDHLGYFWYSF